LFFFFLYCCAGVNCGIYKGSYNVKEPISPGWSEPEILPPSASLESEITGGHHQAKFTMWGKGEQFLLLVEVGFV
jgi:hypothetical protein